MEENKMNRIFIIIFSTLTCVILLSIFMLVTL